MTIDETKRIALRFLKSLETGPEFGLLAEDARWWIQGHSTLTKDEFVKLAEKTARTKAPSVMHIRHVTAEDNRVAIECDGKGRFHDGLPYENSYHFLFFLREGLITEVHEHFDTAYAREVMTAAPR